MYFDVLFRQLVSGGAEEAGMKGGADVRRKFSRPLVHIRQKYGIIYLFSF